MLPLLDVETARQTILRRDPRARAAYPQSVLDGVARVFGAGATPEHAVREIVASVRDGGDAALRRWSAALDGVEVAEFRVPPDRFAEAFEGLAAPVARALRAAAARIRAFHERQPLPNWSTTDLGGVLGQRTRPIERVGVYVPGGSAPLPSSLLMSVIPARVAGVPEIVVCTPPPPHPSILGAAHVCGVTRLYQVGGAQAIAALAFGSESVPRVDKIVGAGNLFVTLAKQQVYGQVGLDGLAGPTETLVIADDSANPAWVAADLLAQAEHDPLATAILLTPSKTLAGAVQAEAGRLIEDLPRAHIIAQSLENNGGIVLTPNLDVAAALANEFAAEHLCLAVEDAAGLAESIEHAGGIFLGEHSFEVLGDYVAGPSHVMPTGGSARFASPLNVLDFVKITSVIGLDDATAAELGSTAATLAKAEQLDGHANAARIRSADGADGADRADGVDRADRVDSADGEDRAGETD